ncbi:MAG: rRNA pseudouridine synthase [Magnetococcales bacterium]|nr:rRNA pseudouridine synthase [Magnetococcales bacterium]
MHTEPIRLQKWLAEAGLCSRREGELWIAAGRVMVNGSVITQPGSKVSNRDQVQVDGRLIQPAREPLVILMLHKPPAVLCTRKDPENRPTVFTLLGEGYARLISVGRLDFNSEGLILFTNHGDVAHQLMHPSNQVPRTYRVRVHGRIDPPMLAKLQAGVRLDDGPTGPLQVTLDHVPGANSWVTITLTEGRNRMVRRIFESVGMEVSRLIRVGYGPCVLGELPRGVWRALQTTEINRLLAPLQEGKRLLELPRAFSPSEKQPAPKPTPPSDTPGRRSQTNPPPRQKPRQPRDKTFGTEHGRSNKRKPH